MTKLNNLIVWSQFLLLGLVVTFLILVQFTEQHARLYEPPARNTMWRFGFNTTPNYEDSEMFCGGITNQWKTNKGKCGICGDSYSLTRPRPYESGGKRTRDITTRIYPPNGEIDIVIDMVANHMGAFEFSLCPRKSPTEMETEECFIPLKVNGSDSYRLTTHRKGFFNLPVQLPKDVTCEYCVFRWHWKSANNWGTCEDGREAVGCGPQETYRNCADIVISNEQGIRGQFANHRIWRKTNKLRIIPNKHQKPPLKPVAEENEFEVDGEDPDGTGPHNGHIRFDDIFPTFVKFD